MTTRDKLPEITGNRHWEPGKVSDGETCPNCGRSVDLMIEEENGIELVIAEKCNWCDMWTRNFLI